jgi:hypothetical protein
MTGMRLWIVAKSSFGGQVTMAQVAERLPTSLRLKDQMPAKANGWPGLALAALLAFRSHHVTSRGVIGLIHFSVHLASRAGASANSYLSSAAIVRLDKAFTFRLVQ